MDTTTSTRTMTDEEFRKWRAQRQLEQAKQDEDDFAREQATGVSTGTGEEKRVKTSNPPKRV
jgi:hypothetical protein